MRHFFLSRNFCQRNTRAFRNALADPDFSEIYSASLAFVRGIHRWPVNSPHKGPVTRKMFPFNDVIMGHYLNQRWLISTNSESRYNVLQKKLNLKTSYEVCRSSCLGPNMINATYGMKMPTHYPTYRNKLKWRLNKTIILFIQQDALKTVVYTMLRGRWVWGKTNSVKLKSTKILEPGDDICFQCNSFFHWNIIFQAILLTFSLAWCVGLRSRQVISEAIYPHETAILIFIIPSLRHSIWT